MITCAGTCRRRRAASPGRGRGRAGPAARSTSAPPSAERNRPASSTPANTTSGSSGEGSRCQTRLNSHGCGVPSYQRCVPGSPSYAKPLPTGSQVRPPSSERCTTWPCQSVHCDAQSRSGSAGEPWTWHHRASPPKNGPAIAPVAPCAVERDDEGALLRPHQHSHATTAPQVDPDDDDASRRANVPPMVPPSGEQITIGDGLLWRPWSCRWGAVCGALTHDGVPGARPGYGESGDGERRPAARCSSRGPDRLAERDVRGRARASGRPCSEPARGNAIHGLVRWSNWRASDWTEDRVTMRLRLHPQPASVRAGPGGPVRHQCRGARGDAHRDERGRAEPSAPGSDHT